MKIKIKFIKEYVAVDPATKSGIIHRFGETEEIEGYTAEWLIDNGFAEKVEEEWPVHGDKCLYVNSDGTCVNYTWQNDTFDIFSHNLKSIGNVFKTKVSAQRFVNYLKAVETVRHDEGFMKYDNTFGEVWALRRAYLDSEKFFTARRIEYEGFHYLGAFYFDTEEHAIASSEKHSNEWQTILNYDWSKGEDEDD